MEPKMRSVKHTRTYNSSGRQAQAARSREAVLDAALQLFLADGYSATTVASIAERADVSVETIYKHFAGKAGLVRAISERQLAGDGPVPTEQASDRMRQLGSDPRVVISKWSEFGVQVLPRVAPILLVVRSAAGADAEMAMLRRELEDARLARMTVNATWLAERGFLRAGVTVEAARDVMYVCSSPELYDMIVLRQGWSGDQFAAFTTSTMIAALLPV